MSLGMGNMEPPGSETGPFIPYLCPTQRHLFGHFAQLQESLNLNF